MVDSAGSIFHMARQPDGLVKRSAAGTYHVLQAVAPGATRFYLSPTYLPPSPPDLLKLKALVGGEGVATPNQIPMELERSLKASGLYVPSFYCFHIAWLDRSAEDHAIDDLNHSRWLLMPPGPPLLYSETPATSAAALGVALPYRMKHKPYTIGLRFNENLARNWSAETMIGGYALYRRNKQLTQLD